MWQSSLLGLILLASLEISTQQRLSTSLVVKTGKGSVRGFNTTASGGEAVSAWYGIPYARPPVGDLRFRHPISMDRWQGVLNATKKPNSCVQNLDTFFPGFAGSEQWNANTKRSEDCLYLNIVVPRDANGEHVTNASVIVWIYGGGYYSGTSTLDIYDMRDFAAKEQVIMVSIQYRVASLAFLFLGTEQVPGNAGMMDQLMALRWIKCNIGQFGGNPKSITIMGESAGAHSVALHLLSPLSKNLFSRAILQSAGSTVPWGYATRQDGFRRSMKLAEVMGCPSNQSRIQDTIGCLRGKDAFDLVANDWEVASSGLAISVFAPIIDGLFLTDEPTVLMRNKIFKQTEILLGSNQDEGNFFILYFASDLFPKEDNVQLTQNEYRSAVDNLYSQSSFMAREAIKHEYNNWLSLDNGTANRINIDRAVGDSQFTCPVVDFAEAYSLAGNRVYMYHFNQVASNSPWPKWTGSMHGDEIQFLFGLPLRAVNDSLAYTEAEAGLSKRMMKYWANFARTGDPSIKPQVSQQTSQSIYARIINYLVGSSTEITAEDSWPPYSLPSRQTKLLNAAAGPPEILNQGSSPLIAGTARRCNFWGSLIPNLSSKKLPLRKNN